MRHRVAHRKLGRVTEHRIAMLRNQALDLIRRERIQTTVPRAKELRPFVERLITIAKRGEADGRALFARRLVARDLHDPDVVRKLFDTLAPRFAARPGGYTRVLKLGHRRGDNAEVAQIELVGSEYDPKAAGEKAGKEPAEAQAGAKAQGVGGRLRAAAQRLRGRKAAPETAEEGSSETAGKRSGKSRSRASSQKKKD
jgi:large subunit ribosomal protein L17